MRYDSNGKDAFCLDTFGDLAQHVHCAGQCLFHVLNNSAIRLSSVVVSAAGNLDLPAI